MGAFGGGAKGKWIRALVLLCAACLALYLFDYLSLRLGIPKRPQFGTVIIHRFYRIPLKNGKVELDYDGDYPHDCVHSLLPHFGEQPCWYLSRKTEQWVDVQSGTPNNPHIF